MEGRRDRPGADPAHRRGARREVGHPARSQPEGGDARVDLRREVAQRVQGLEEAGGAAGGARIHGSCLQAGDGDGRQHPVGRRLVLGAHLHPQQPVGGHLRDPFDDDTRAVGVHDGAAVLAVDGVVDGRARVAAGRVLRQGRGEAAAGEQADEDALAVGAPVGTAPGRHRRLVDLAPGRGPALDCLDPGPRRRHLDREGAAGVGDRDGARRHAVHGVPAHEAHDQGRRHHGAAAHPAAPGRGLEARGHHLGGLAVAARPGGCGRGRAVGVGLGEGPGVRRHVGVAVVAGGREGAPYDGVDLQRHDVAHRGRRTRIGRRGQRAVGVGRAAAEQQVGQGGQGVDSRAPSATRFAVAFRLIRGKFISTR